MCLRWQKSYLSFLEDMGRRPEDKSSGLKRPYSLDRIDNSKGYCKSNCRWANAKEQTNNRTTSIRIEYEGRLVTFQELSDILGIPHMRLRQRVNNGWPVERLSEPVGFMGSGIPKSKFNFNKKR